MIVVAHWPLLLSAQARLGGRRGLAVAGDERRAAMLCIAQVGPVLGLIPAVIWVYSRSGAVWGTGFLVWAIFCSIIDNVMRPLLIKRGADLPLLLIFTGVIGGLIAFGVIGLFIGPVVLAVAYTLLVAWVSESEPSDERTQSESSFTVREAGGPGDAS